MIVFSLFCHSFCWLISSQTGNKASPYIFCNIDPITKAAVYSHLDPDGLPVIGSRLDPGAPLYAYINTTTQKLSCTRTKSSEPCVVDQVCYRTRSKADTGIFMAAIFRFESSDDVLDRAVHIRSR